MTTWFPRSTMLFRLLSVAAVLLLGCPSSLMGRSPAAGKPVRVRLGQEFNLRVGQQAEVEGGRFRVRFASVVNDSRCPPDVTCVWAGNAEVLIEAEAGRSRARLKLNTQDGVNFPKERRHQQYSVELVELSSHSRKNSGKKATDYVATLVIRKK
jgi:hypothetical protein